MERENSQEIEPNLPVENYELAKYLAGDAKTTVFVHDYLEFEINLRPPKGSTVDVPWVYIRSEKGKFDDDHYHDVIREKLSKVDSDSFIDFVALVASNHIRTVINLDPTDPKVSFSKLMRGSIEVQEPTAIFEYLNGVLKQEAKVKNLVDRESEEVPESVRTETELFVDIDGGRYFETGLGHFTLGHDSRLCWADERWVSLAEELEKRGIIFIDRDEENFDRHSIVYLHGAVDVEQVQQIEREIIFDGPMDPDQTQINFLIDTILSREEFKALRDIEEAQYDPTKVFGEDD